jgi:hypothetical protein
VLAHESRQAAPWLIFDVRQKMVARPKYEAAEALRIIEEQMRQILASSGDVYGPACEIWKIAFSHARHYPEYMEPLWLVWGALTDHFEMRPEESEVAAAEVRNACREWLELDRDDLVQRKNYFTRWIERLEIRAP